MAEAREKMFKKTLEKPKVPNSKGGNRSRMSMSKSMASTREVSPTRG